MIGKLLDHKRALALCAVMAIFETGSGLAQAQTAPAYACVQFNGSFLKTFQPVTDGQACESPLTRMLVAARTTLLFAASGAQNPDDAGSAYVARFLPYAVSLTEAYPMAIAITLNIDTDQGMYAIPAPSDTAAGVECIPVFDGKAAGNLTTLSTAADAIGRAAGNRYPHTLWSILGQPAGIATGQHQVAMACKADTPFYFRGLATLTVLQQIPGN